MPAVLIDHVAKTAIRQVASGRIPVLLLGNRSWEPLFNTTSASDFSHQKLSLRPATLHRADESVIEVIVIAVPGVEMALEGSVEFGISQIFRRFQEQ
jgi:hypothetical protein